MSVPDPPWKRATKVQRSRRSETQGAKLEGGRRVPMSGGGRQKGDIRSGIWLIEDKYTDAESYRIDKKVLDKTSAEALNAGELPQWRITLPGYKLRVLREEDYLYLQALAESKIDDGSADAR